MELKQRREDIRPEGWRLLIVPYGIETIFEDILFEEIQPF